MPLILRELMADIRTFNDIQRGIPLISRAVLTARLRELEHHGIIERRKREGRQGTESRQGTEGREGAEDRAGREVGFS